MRFQPIVCFFDFTCCSDTIPCHLLRVYIQLFISFPGIISFASAAILKIPTNVRVDLVIIGHGPTETVQMDCHLLRWLQQHQALSCAVHIMPRTNVFKESAYRKFPSRWIVDLGLPVLLPTQVVDPPLSSTSGSRSSAAGSYTTSHFLVDVGMSRNLVRRLTGDLKLLPPYGLFDASSVVSLRADLGGTVPSNP